MSADTQAGLRGGGGGRQRLSSSNFLSVLSLQLRVCRVGVCHELGTSAFLGKDTGLFAVEP